MFPGAGPSYGSYMASTDLDNPETKVSRHALRRTGGWLLLVLAIPVGASIGIATLVLVSVYAGNRGVGAAAGAIALVLVTGGLSRLGARGATRSSRTRRWLPGVVTGLSLAGVGTMVGLVVFAQAAPPTAFPVTVAWEHWELSTGSRIAYAHTPAQGTARPTPVILVHGGPGAPEAGVDLIAPALADAGFDVYRYHQIGAGLSERLEDVSEYTVNRHVADLEAIRQEIGANRMILIGESWGGTLIAHYLAAHPDRVAQAVVSSPGSIWAPAFADTNGLTDSARRDQRQVIGRYPRFMLAHILLGTMGPDTAHTLFPSRAMDGQFEELVGSLDLWGGCSMDQHPNGQPVHDKQAGVGFWANAVTTFDVQHVPDPRPELRSVATPLLVLRSECDYRAWDATREYRDLFPNAVMITIEGAGHVIPEDKPDLYQEAVISFLLDQPLPRQPYTGSEAPW
jgi:proline iminopeptidase